jgi:hypothetical protein
LPFLYALAAFRLSKLPRLIQMGILLAIFVGNIIGFLFLINPDPQVTIERLSYDLSYGLFGDIYEYTSHTDTALTRSQFEITGKELYSLLHIKKTQVQYPNGIGGRFKNTVEIPVILEYTFQMGTIKTRPTNVPLKKQKGEWNISWDWNMFFPPEITE